MGWFLNLKKITKIFYPLRDKELGVFWCCLEIHLARVLRIDEEEMKTCQKETTEIRIDGSRWEGGGQLLRSALSLSAVIGKSFYMEKIRARKIYEVKKQRNQIAGPFVEVNCSTLRGETAMSTLFGHRKGAFTGAAAHRPGLLKSADGGLLFLDEIGELGPDEQTMLLRALEEKSFLPMGADQEVASDFQFISGTNRDLLEQVSQGNFRSDLFARINLWTFELPGLKDRREDIEPNIEYELEQLTRSLGRRVSFNKEAYRAFLKFAKDPASIWEGNFRDLNASLTRLATLAGDHRISKLLVEEETWHLQKTWQRTREIEEPERAMQDILKQFLSEDQLEEIDRFDQVQLAEVIKVCQESKSQSEAGRTLFNASRTRRKIKNDSDRLRKYLAGYGLDWEKITG